MSAPVVLTGATSPAVASTTTTCSRLASAKNLSSVAYADRLVRAWGRDDSAAVNCYASSTAARTLFRQSKSGGIHWRRVSAHGAAGTIYVTYHDDARGGNLTIGVHSIGLRARDGWHAAYTARFRGEPKAWNAVQWSDNLVLAWGRGDRKWMSYYATPRVVQQLVRIAPKGGAHWQRVAEDDGLGNTWVTYRNTVTKHTLTIAVSRAGLSQGDAHAAYGIQYR